jgi:RING-type zinc-finger
MYAARNYTSPRAGGDGDEEQSYKKLSVEDLHKMIAQKFDQLGNQATLTAESFRADDPPPREAHEIIKRDDSDTSDDESTADVDLEEGPADYDGHIVVNRTATDSLSEELAAPNCCAICLESYTCGEEVVWSANEKCHHIYHKDCIAAYFAHAKKKKSKKKCACPTCRQEFLVLDFPSETKGKADEERAQSEAASTMEATWRARQERILGNRI